MDWISDFWQYIFAIGCGGIILFVYNIHNRKTKMVHKTDLNIATFSLFKKNINGNEGEQKNNRNDVGCNAVNGVNNIVTNIKYDLNALQQQMQFMQVHYLQSVFSVYYLLYLNFNQTYS